VRLKDFTTYRLINDRNIIRERLLRDLLQQSRERKGLLLDMLWGQKLRPYRLELLLTFKTYISWDRVFRD
jgi:hypothetical protein